MGSLLTILQSNLIRHPKTFNWISPPYKSLVYYFAFSLILLPVFVYSKPTTNVHLTLVTEHVPPYQYLGDDGIVEGMSVDYIKAALALTPFSYHMQIFPWVRSYDLARNKKNTCVFLISKTAQRLPLFQWSSSIITTDDYFIGLKSNTKINIHTLEDAKKYKIAVIRNDRTHKMLVDKGFVENKNLYIVNNTYSLLKLLIKRPEIDLILADKIVVHYRALFNHLSPTLFKSYFKLSDSSVPLYLACNKMTSHTVMEQISNAMDKLKRDGTYDAIEKHWLQKITYLK